MTPVLFHFIKPTGIPIANTTIEIQLSKSTFDPEDSGVLMPSLVTAMTDDDGRATVELWPSDKLYYVTVMDPDSDAGLSYKFLVPEVTPGLEVRLQDIVVVGEMSPTFYDEAALLVIQSTKTTVLGYQVTAMAARDAALAAQADALASATVSSTKATEAAASAVAADNASRLTVGTVTTGAPGSSAAVTITGVSGSQVLNLTVPQGPAGSTGGTGLQGPQGIPGTVGATGPAGTDGVDGTNGTDGAVGPQGPAGPKGDTGDAGPQGIQGIQGIQGDTGPAGASGSGTGDMLKADNLTGLANYGTARTNLGLGNVSNTSDANKPVSTAQAAADTAIGTAAATDATTKANAAQAAAIAASAPSGHVGSGAGAHANAVAGGAAGFMTGTDKTKLDGVEASANNYTHPGTHAPSIIAQDSTNRFVTDAEKATWNAKQAAGTYATGTGSATGTNTGDNAANTTYAADYRAANFVAGTHYLSPTGSAATLTGFPTFNQDTTGFAGALKSATTTVSVSGAAAPTPGQVLTATSDTGATWQTPTTNNISLSVANTWTAAQTFTNSLLKLLGSSTGATTFASANASATNYTLTFPAITDTLVTLTAAQTLTNKTLTAPVLGTPASGNLSNCTSDGTSAVGFRGIPQNSKSTSYTLILSDAGKHILHPSTDATARTFAIPANSSVAFPIGTTVTFINQNGGGVVSIAINDDNMRLAGAGTTGTRSLAANGVATAVKIAGIEWIIYGTGLT